ncbi:uncharacterized protein ARB_06442 [Trichophyton benhamiae CBS 112371]|uniref:Myb-like domain-containing protein n=1 Tax=Arthroderma benhamiae (strain ATCC MYA-4681 / CBS 112371) TaxID=663331 RepID=D4AQD5_ARTBC|nr:uncharacterized protein ARB_06442 [Trichophyton benhamiae CBS 112371]EFE34679.1 hypothetical protein ARB_06442 [Trichophyton benhamiae CBS 112371]
MASRRQLSRIGTPSNGQSHASLSKCALVSNCPPYPVDMPFQLNEGQSETFYATKSDKSSDSNENQTEQQLMNSHCPLQREGVSGYMDQAKTGSLSSRDIGIWVNSWRVNHSYASSPSSATISIQGPTTHDIKYQSTPAPSAPWSQCEISPMTIAIEQPPQTPPRENWQPTSTLNSTTGSRDDKTYPPFEWQMKSSPDILPLTASTVREVGRMCVDSEHLVSGYLMSPATAECPERTEVEFYPYYAQNTSCPSIPYVGSQHHPWTNIPYPTVTSIPTQYPSSPWDATNDSYSNDYGFYCGPSSPFSSAVSSTATPDLPLTTKNPETLVTAENNMYLDGADLESTSEGYSRASSNADTDADAQYTPTGGEDEQAKIRACRSYSQRNDERDAFLIECKLAGMSYKEIKAKGKFTVAESTLRGRFRSLTKRKELRVRKPGWQDSDLKLLCEAVKRFAEPQSVSLIGDELLPPKISWKQVGEYIWKKGGSYHFGNATCKKKWAELQRNHAYVQKVSLNQSF